ncbi:histidine ammonia-lyase [Microscilla marina]|uniref:Histidine ammonia-lyase n=1 Tax=Microscilla marina ATCC 23134 TaxID=313606 RepID=A1ZCN6_MICM2|nr:histidine ammonia-lyase [Microscilla marina]EAY32038.1 histidine ammonia-lyase [Microscilla marina ATCC 23134]
MDKSTHYISSEWLSLDQVKQVLNQQIALSDNARERVVQCRSYLDNKLAKEDTPIYGINTGFGSLCDQEIDKKDLAQLQANLVKSHACGTGDEVPQDVVKTMLLLKVQSLSYGHSGIALETIQRLIDFYNHDVIPVVYQLGSLGASGDLAPLAHIALPLLGLGEAYFEGKVQPAAQILAHFGWEPIELQSKEGLALLNGTQFMSAFGTICLLRIDQLLKASEVITALSFDGYDCLLSPYNDLIHQARPHPGQIQVAKNIRELLEGSEIAQQKKPYIQDPYSFRCVPQVHGATYDALNYCREVILREINSVTDNPNIFPDEDKILSGGNFHGQPLALALDFLSIAVAELANISERRTYTLISGKRDLPAFLIASQGLNSGFMIPQYTAASIVSQNKQLCTPASIDSIVSSNGQEDHVSMGANAATKALKVVQNVERVLAIELMTAAQAIEFRRPMRTSKKLEKLMDDFRAEVPFVEDDKVMYTEIDKALKFVQTL